MSIVTSNSDTVPIFVSMVTLLCLMFLALHSILVSVWDLFKSNWDMFISILLVLIHTGANIEEIIKNGPGGTDVEGNKIRSDSFSTASTGGITAVSVLIPATLVIVQIGSQPGGQPLPIQTKEFIFRAAIYFFISLFFGLLAMYSVPKLGKSQDVTRKFVTILPFGYQFIALVTGVSCLIKAFYHFLYLT